MAEGVACKCFNGATAMKPWKRTASTSYCNANTLLQWGHGDEAVEEQKAQLRSSDSRSLQWGHGDEAVEEHGPS